MAKEPDSTNPSLVVFLAVKKHSLAELCDLAALVRAEDCARVSVVIPPELESPAKELCRGLGLDYRALPPQAPKAVGLGESLLGLAERVARKLMGWAGGRLFAQRRYARELDYQLLNARRILDEMRPAYLVLTNGRLRNWELAFMKAAGERGIRRVVPCYAFSGLALDLVQARKSGDHQARFHARAARRYPRQFFVDPRRGESYSFYPAYMLGAAERAGALPPNPWVPGGNLCELVMVTGMEAQRLMVENGAEARRLVITGQLSHDILHERLRDKERLSVQLRQGYGLADQGKLVALAMPQYGEHGTLPWPEHWRCAHLLCESLRRSGAACLVSLHPRMDPSAYRFVEDQYGLRIAEERLADILPACDLFVSNLSSTLEWAVLCGIPAVAVNFANVDQYHFGGLQGVEVARDPDDFAVRLDRMLSDERHYGEAVQGQVQRRADLSPFDGRCGQRIMSAILGRP